MGETDIAVWVQIALGVATLAGLLFNGLTAMQAKWAAHAAEHQSKQNSADLRVVKEDVRTIELATNSMKDALILAERASSLAKGQEEGRLGEVARQAGIADNSPG